MKSRRTKACDIPRAVKLKVWERDNHQCILCHSPYAFPECHFVSRAHNGKGIEENVFTACRACHMAYDGLFRDELRDRIRNYLKSHYPGWDERKLYYTKWGQFNEDGSI